MIILRMHNRFVNAERPFQAKETFAGKRKLILESRFNILHVIQDGMFTNVISVYIYRQVLDRNG